MFAGIFAAQGRRRASAATGFTAEAVVFDGTSDGLSATSLTGTADGKQGTISLWAYFNNLPSTNPRFMYFGNGIDQQFTIYQNTSSGFSVWGQNVSGTNVLLAHSTTTLTTGTWYHIIASWDLSTTTYQLYINDTVDSVTPSTITNDNIDYTVTDFTLMYNKFPSPANFIDADISEFWFDDSYIDISTTTNRRKFITASGTPENVGSDGSTPTGTSPLIYFSGVASTWNAGTNSGAGGNFTMTGAVADSANEPVAI